MQKNISLIVACDENRLIGRDGDLPWRLPNDLKHFKTLTIGKTILMGRKTWDSLGRPLPQRENWVLSRDAAFAPEGCRVFGKLEDALSAHADGELMIIGGAELYRQALAHARRVYLTQVHAREQGDTWFPDFSDAGFHEVQREDHAADDRHAYSYSFLVLERT